MARKSKIEWTESTWNPVTGCTKISIGCRNCYAARFALRLKAAGSRNYANGFRVALHPHLLEMPLRWKQPRTIFVNSMSDLFHKDVPLEFILKIFDVMQRASHHRFQVLTKRSGRLLQLSPNLPWPQNVWMGVTVENADCIYRMDNLRQTPAAIKFISFEPLLGPIPNINLEGINWVIVGGESGPGARPMESEWATDIRDQCLTANVPFFFKQWGGTNKKKNGRTIEGRVWNQIPKQAEFLKRRDISIGECATIFSRKETLVEI
ncbi:MAG TPA: phage Gp37/Gp68 family protein [Sedimentisphaerales bacterium]|nr:phage Gp37/Gp68 family protein [Sedimentisphaerales bacterium]